VGARHFCFDTFLSPLKGAARLAGRVPFAAPTKQRAAQTLGAALPLRLPEKQL
jgi:hypothetical protein